MKDEGFRSQKGENLWNNRQRVVLPEMEQVHRKLLEDLFGGRRPKVLHKMGNRDK